jgi:hypothetical protein
MRQALRWTAGYCRLSWLPSVSAQSW